MCAVQPKVVVRGAHHILSEFYCDSSCVTAFPGQTGRRASGGAGTQHQESGFLVQTHHTYRLHY